MADQPAFRWSGPTLSIGWIVALIVLVIDIILKMMGLVEMPECLAIAAICAIRL